MVSLADGLHVNNIAIIDVVADRLVFCRVQSQEPTCSILLIARGLGNTLTRIKARCGVHPGMAAAYVAVAV